MQFDELTHTIIGASMEVHRALGPGFLESIYRKALLHELTVRGLSARTEVEIQVQYKNLIVGKHRLDILVESIVVVELKALNGIAPIHLAQVLSYLKAADVRIGLLINFGEDQLQFKRLIRSIR